MDRIVHRTWLAGWGVVLIVALSVLPAFGPAVGQTQPQPPKGKAVPMPGADSVRAVMKALDQKDTTALKKFGLYPPPGARRDEPRKGYLAIMTRTDRDSIVLRWAPTKSGAWIETNRYGYVLERVTMTGDGKAVPGSFRKMTQAPMKPWSLDEWKQRAQRDDRYAAIAAQALYGKSFKPRSDVPEGVSMRAAVDELEGRFGFALFAADNDPLVATGLALRYVDRDVKQGEQYVYRLRIAIKDTAYHIDTAYAAASAVPQSPPPPPKNLTAQGFDRHITLRWEDYPAGKAFSAYNVYRSEDQGRTFRKINTNPVVTPYRQGVREEMTPNYTDTTVVNYFKYRYQVRGITPFAELSKPAEIEGEATDLMPPPRPVIGKPEQIARHSVRITWQMPDTVKDLAGFVVSRSVDNMQGYVPITATVHLPPVKKGEPPRNPDLEIRDIMKQLLPPSTRSYIDENATSAEPYYMVGAVDTAGNLAQSLPAYAAIIDSVPPRMPTGLAGKIDTNGVVHLHWNLDPSPNVIGYRVVWANDPRHEFTQRTPRVVKDTVFTDTINIHTLTRYIYYRIASVNNRFIHSPLSPMLALHRPDVVPPGAPQFTKVIVSDSSVALTWAPSSSDDVRQQRLYKRKSVDTAWVLLASLSPTQTSYNDHAVVQRVMYEYSLEAIDSSGLHSVPSVPAQGRPYDTGERPGVTGLKAAANERGTAVRVSWAYTAPLKEKHWFIVYRSYGDNGLIQYRSVDGAAREFDDGDLVGKGTYKYAVRVATDRGGRSPVSTPVTVQIR